MWELEMNLGKSMQMCPYFIVLGLCLVFWVHRIGSSGWPINQVQGQGYFGISIRAFLGAKKRFYYKPRKWILYIDVICNSRLCERVKRCESSLSRGLIKLFVG